MDTVNNFNSGTYKENTLRNVNYEMLNFFRKKLINIIYDVKRV